MINAIMTFIVGGCIGVLLLILLTVNSDQLFLLGNEKTIRHLCEVNGAMEQPIQSVYINHQEFVRKP